jgi:tRNA (adenine22-N1)-methyltransferase
MKTVELSARMQAFADMVSKGSIVCDVGCDHGWVSIYLIQQGIASKVYAMDVGIGPLERAKDHIQSYNLGNYIETRLSDGLAALQVGEADCMVCAGMGGPLMMRILSQGRDKAKAMKELILQPQSEIAQFRAFLRGEGYKIVKEDMILEDGKYYPMMKVIPGGVASAEETAEQCIYDAYGELLLKAKHPVLQEYVNRSMEQAKALLQHLAKQETMRARERMEQIEKELTLLQAAKDYMV